MTGYCCICQDITMESDLQVASAQIGSPSIALNKLLLQCFDHMELPQCAKASNARLCSGCIEKLLEFYDAILRLEATRFEFQQRAVEHFGPVKKLLEEDDFDFMAAPQSDDDEVFIREEYGHEAFIDAWRSSDSEDGDNFIPEPSVSNEQFDDDLSSSSSEEDTDSRLVKPKCITNEPLQAEIKVNRFCIECNIEYPSESVLQMHIQKVHAHLPIKSSLHCIECALDFLTEDIYRVHMQQMHNRRDCEFPCPHCNRSFNTHALFLDHITKEHICTGCDKIAPHRRALLRHMQKHKPGSKYLCDECGMTLRSQFSLKKHRLTHEGGKKYDCSLCGNILRNNASFQRHLKKHRLDNAKFNAPETFVNF